MPGASTTAEKEEWKGISRARDDGFCQTPATSQWGN
jgi:hypothetical protein